MKVKFKKLNPVAVTPTYAKPGDAGLDLTAVSIKQTRDYIQYGIGIAVEIPEGHVGLLCPRSSVTDLSLIMKNCIGIIDSGYRGELKVRFQATKDLKRKFVHADGEGEDKRGYVYGQYKYIGNKYDVGQRVAQLIIIPIPFIELEQVDELSETKRSTDGYGSTGK